MTAPDILTPSVREPLEGLKVVATSLRGAMEAYLASLEAALLAAYGEDALGPMALGRHVKRVRQALGSLQHEVTTLEEETEQTAVEEQRAAFMCWNEREAS